MHVRANAFAYFTLKKSKARAGCRPRQKSIIAKRFKLGASKRKLGVCALPLYDISVAAALIHPW
jgi:hypothetical protein